MALSSEKTALHRFGANVARIRTSKSLTQEQLAEKTDLDRMTIAFVENGRRWPRLSTIQAIANALNVNIRDLFANL
ncbi:MAG TPA: helix-turn-helix transcriptional regulator [Candidatus Saccharimonadales bacterium]|nr:helix-turn-helix transcriptional regulator [Candidatus Saccharimonadales bacterium]